MKKSRRSMRLNGYDYSRTGAYFVTICAQNRECLFGDIANSEMTFNDAGRMAKQCWNDIPAHFPHVGLDTYVVMPNHVHGILVITNDIVVVGANVGAKNFSPLRREPQRPCGTSKTIGSVVRGFKIGVTKWIHQNTTIHNVWQRNYYEHIIRNEGELNLVREYIINNPAQWTFDHENPNPPISVGAKNVSPLQSPKPDYPWKTSK